VTQHRLPGIRQYDTHGELIGRGDPPAAPAPARDLDAIIVPASRPAANLDHAVTLARAARSQLVVLCSRQAQAGAVHELLAARSFAQAIVIELPSGYDHPLMEFATSQSARMDLPEACTTRDTDLSMKRNVGLILARMLGWQRVFFMDDDIRDIHLPALHATVSMLGQYRSVGMRVTSFPDNSVVCHAHRETGAFQDVSVSGSALAVDCAGCISFFPDIYNEDWLFFFHDAAERKLGCSGLNATQLRYDPFKDPQRAAGQEFGDLLAEGLYALLHRGGDAWQATRDYWVDFLNARRRFLDAIIERCGEAKEPLRQKIFDAVTAAQECSAQIRPEQCARYVELWLQDRERWQRRLKETPHISSIKGALDQLGLAAAEDDCSQWLHPAHADFPAVTPAGPASLPSLVRLGELSSGNTLAAGPSAVTADAKAASVGRLPAYVAGICALAMGAVTTWPQRRRGWRRWGRD